MRRRPSRKKSLLPLSNIEIYELQQRQKRRDLNAITDGVRRRTRQGM